MKNIHILPTDKPSKVWFDNDAKQFIYGINSVDGIYTCKNQNIYITNDEETKEGVNQWYLDKVLNKPYNSGGAQYSSRQDVIILTDNKDLIKEGVQAIDDEFLEWFVKNPSCEEVEVNLIQTEPLKGFIYNFEYKIIIPKEEPVKSTKDRILSETPDEVKQRAREIDNSLVSKQGTSKEEPSMVDKLKEYLNTHSKEQIQKDWDDTCEQTKGVISPTVFDILELGQIIPKGEPKQETLEEQNKKSFGEIWSTLTTEQSEYLRYYINRQREDAKKWQQERMYSEEEVGYLVYNVIGEYGKFCDIMIDGEKINKLFFQFKKK